MDTEFLAHIKLSVITILCNTSEFKTGEDLLAAAERVTDFVLSYNQKQYDSSVQVQKQDD